MQPYDFLSAGSKKLAKISDYTGWASCILNHIGDGSTVSEREYVAFLNMWLERFSSSVGHLVVRLTIINSWQSIWQWARIFLLESIC